MDSTDSSAIDQADISRLVKGDDTALNDLIDRHGTMVFRFLSRMLGNEDDANDLAQETFVRVYQNRFSFRSGAKFTSWLYTIAGNLARNHHRWRSRHPTVPIDAGTGEGDPHLINTLPASAPAPDQSTMAAERAAAVNDAVQALPSEMREAIVLCEWEEMPVVEAARLLNATPKAVELRLYRARKMLRERLSRWL